MCTRSMSSISSLKCIRPRLLGKNEFADFIFRIGILSYMMDYVRVFWRFDVTLLGNDQVLMHSNGRRKLLAMLKCKSSIIVICRFSDVWASIHMAMHINTHDMFNCHLMPIRLNIMYIYMVLFIIICLVLLFNYKQAYWTHKIVNICLML